LRTQSIDSIAVLPFANVGGDPETEYLSDGVTESVISSLSRIPKLKVIAFASVLRYKGKTVDVQEVVRERRCHLTGRILQRGNNLSVTTELMDYLRPEPPVGRAVRPEGEGHPGVQDDIAQKISAHLRQHLTGEERTPPENTTRTTPRRTSST
jgi:TolB-like protein